MDAYMDLVSVDFGQPLLFSSKGFLLLDGFFNNRLSHRSLTATEENEFRFSLLLLYFNILPSQISCGYGYVPSLPFSLTCLVGGRIFCCCVNYPSSVVFHRPECIFPVNTLKKVLMQASLWGEMKS
uniref:Uncharacterized protein n=1 Tax=Zea mays TaxID=4577 RepID=C0P2I5_MAIZE|nr:unknown [Zea mays]